LIVPTLICTEIDIICRGTEIPEFLKEETEGEGSRGGSREREREHLCGDFMSGVSCSDVGRV
jgi:hypothetical protein